MTLQDTHIYIRVPVSELVTRLATFTVRRNDSVGVGEVLYTIANGPDEPPRFGLLADLNAPTGQNWTHLLHANPEDHNEVTQAVQALAVSADDLQSATDWDDNQLAPMDSIIAKLSSVSRKPVPRTAPMTNDHTTARQKARAVGGLPAPRRGGQTGTVKFFNSTKGFGFIAPDTGGADVFVHISALERSGLSELHEGDKVTFETARSERTGKSEVKSLRTE